MGLLTVAGSTVTLQWYPQSGQSEMLAPVFPHYLWFWWKIQDTKYCRHAKPEQNTFIFLILTVTKMGWGGEMYYPNELSTIFCGKLKTISNLEMGHFKFTIALSSNVPHATIIVVMHLPSLDCSVDLGCMTFFKKSYSSANHIFDNILTLLSSFSEALNSHNIHVCC